MVVTILGNTDTTFVHQQVPVRMVPSQQEPHRIPDLLITFDVDPAMAKQQMGYSIQDQGKPPDFVLESSFQKHRRGRLHTYAHLLAAIDIRGSMREIAYIENNSNG